MESFLSNKPLAALIKILPMARSKDGAGVGCLSVGRTDPAHPVPYAPLNCYVRKKYRLCRPAMASICPFIRYRVCESL